MRAVADGLHYFSRTINETMVEEYINLKELSDQKSPLERLSLRERDILRLIVEGKSNPEVSDILYISVKTVETYRSRMMKKLGIKDFSSLVKFAIVHGVTTLNGHRNR